MRMINLKNTDLFLSNICLGTSPFGGRMDEAHAFEILDAFVAAGGNFIDTANAYCRWIPGLDNCSEQIIGNWLRSRKCYDKVMVASKGGHYDCRKGLTGEMPCRATKEDMYRDLEESLATLGLDHFDLYWIHRDNPALPMGEILDFMEELVKSGKIRYYGLSNYSLTRLMEGEAYVKEKGVQGFCAVSNQWSLAASNRESHYNPDPTIVICDEDEYAWHLQNSMPLVPFTSTARGFFTKLQKLDAPVKDGKLRIPPDELAMDERVKYPYLNERNLHLYEELLALSAETGYSLQMLSVAYLTNQPFQVIPVSSFSRLEQMEDFIAASEITLDRGIIKKFAP